MALGELPNYNYSQWLKLGAATSPLGIGTPRVTPDPTSPAATTPQYTAPTTDYAALLESLLGPLRQEAAGASAADKASLLANQRRAIIQFGEPLSGIDQSLVGPYFGEAATADTLNLAKQNTSAGLSVVARLNQAHQDALANIKNTLAARGLFNSGETGYQMGREQTAYTQSQYDARQKVLDYLGGAYSAYAQAEQQRKWALAMAAMGAAGQIPTAPPGYTPTGDVGVKPIVTTLGGQSPAAINYIRNAGIYW